MDGHRRNQETNNIDDDGKGFFFVGGISRRKSGEQKVTMAARVPRQTRTTFSSGAWLILDTPQATDNSPGNHLYIGGNRRPFRPSVFHHLALFAPSEMKSRRRIYCRDRNFPK